MIVRNHFAQGLVIAEEGSLEVCFLSLTVIYDIDLTNYSSYKFFEQVY